MNHIARLPSPTAAKPKETTYELAAPHQSMLDTLASCNVGNQLGQDLLTLEDKIMAGRGTTNAAIHLRARVITRQLRTAYEEKGNSRLWNAITREIERLAT